jgi:hypothetical protein
VTISCLQNYKEEAFGITERDLYLTKVEKMTPWKTVSVAGSNPGQGPSNYHYHSLDWQESCWVAMNSQGVLISYH